MNGNVKEKTAMEDELAQQLFREVWNLTALDYQREALIDALDEIQKINKYYKENRYEG